MKKIFINFTLEVHQNFTEKDASEVVNNIIEHIFEEKKCDITAFKAIEQVILTKLSEV